MNWKMGLAACIIGVSTLLGTVSADVSYEHVRNATGKLSYNDTTFLIDPMLADKGAYEGFAGTFHSEIRNPTVDLPMSKKDVLAGVDAIIVTHTHLDHWDKVAETFIDKTIPVFVQNESDANIVKKAGFTHVTILDKAMSFQGVSLTPVEDTHGTQAMYDDPKLGAALGESMGVVFAEPGEKTTYLMGDTVWTPRVTKTLYNEKPDILIMNTGYAKMINYNESIIMGTEDVAKAATQAPQAAIITVHMDAINHCTVSRSDMRQFVKDSNLSDRVYVVNDGETVRFGKK